MAMPTEMVETHTAILFFIGDRVFKLKKAVNLGFFEHSTREARLLACHREVDLNRRLAPDVYLGVFDIMDESGEPSDHLVAMRRMPEDRRLARCLGRGEDVRPALRSIIHLITTLHAQLASDLHHDGLGEAGSIRQRWTEGFDQLREVPIQDDLREKLGQMEALALRYVDGRSPLFRQRIESGRIRDGHGDLQAEDIFILDDGPRILDCIEFGDDYRWGDVLSDVAFLAMDLERLGRPDLAEYTLGLHHDLSGDRWPATLADHYIAYRAHVRAKVGIIRHHQRAEAVGSEVETFVDLALSHLARAQVRVTMVGGLPGTGKSTVAVGLAERSGGVLLRSDVIRQQTPTPDHGDVYSAQSMNAVYAQMLQQARSLLSKGEHVVLDATWGNPEHRAAIRDLASETRSELHELRCVLPADEADERIKRRIELGQDPSEATPAVASELASRFAPWPEAEELLTKATPDEVLTRAVQALHLQ